MCKQDFEITSKKIVWIKTKKPSEKFFVLSIHKKISAFFQQVLKEQNKDFKSSRFLFSSFFKKL